MSKASAMLGIWAESDDDDDNNDNDESNGRRNREKQSKSSTISFVSSANEKQTKTTPKQQPDEEADDSNSDASSDEEEKISTRHTDKIILENLDEIEKEVKEKRINVDDIFNKDKTDFESLNINYLNLAVSDKNESIDYYISKKHLDPNLPFTVFGANGIIKRIDEPEYSDVLKIESITLDSFLEDKNRKINLFKLTFSSLY
jgi:hypothetical protein